MKQNNEAVLQRFSVFYEELTDKKFDDLAGIYDEEILFIDPVTSHHGLNAVVAYFKSMSENCLSCRFKIENTVTAHDQAVLSWEMHFQHSKLKKGKTIVVEGVSVVKIKNDRIYFQRDYYDLGAMLYEQIPILGGLIRHLRVRLA